MTNDFNIYPEEISQSLSCDDLHSCYDTISEGHVVLKEQALWLL